MSLKDSSLFRQAALIAGEWIEADPANTIEVNKAVHVILDNYATHKQPKVRA